ncbi:MAG TPA: class I SAM-dependent methyltransferase [Solirubrobacteraceae bacterium]|nr:class I SAM-dependent methyltransferase [Solirubrobacteraceae bacterium]
MAGALSTLRSSAVAAMLDRVHAAAAREDGLAKQRVREREAQIGHRLSQAQRYELYGEAPLAIKREVGELLYVVALGSPGRRMVEFGASHGLSTAYLAAALRDSGGGALITTERHPAKAETATRNLTDAGLSDLVEIRVGDALQTLGTISGPVDLVFLDGSNDLYLQVLNLVESHLRVGALVVADLSADDPDLLPYLHYARDERNGFVSIEVPLAAGVELSVRTTTV